MITRKQLEEMAQRIADGFFDHQNTTAYEAVIEGFLAAVPIIFEAAIEGRIQNGEKAYINANQILEELRS